MNWIGIIRWIPRWGKQQLDDRIGHDGEQAVGSVDCLPYLRYLRCRLFVLLCVCTPLYLRYVFPVLST